MHSDSPLPEETRHRPVEAMSHRCQGQCRRYRTCEGIVSRVHVRDDLDGFDWGEFWYCGTALTEDRQHGLMVTLVTAP